MRRTRDKNVKPVVSHAKRPDLSVTVAGITMQNPVMTASGTFGYAQEFEPYVDLSRLGAIVVKTITRTPRAGNPPPRIVETPGGMLNAIGLQNVGVHAFIEEKLPYLRKLGPPVIVNIAGESIDDYVELAKRLSDQEGISGIELNISCPNVADGLIFGCNAVLAHKLISQVRQATLLPLIPKLSPNITDVVEIAQSLADAGADALSLINTLIGMAIDVRSRRPKLGNVTGGLSGPAIRPVAVRMVWEVARAVKLPLIGMGGIITADDALEFLIAGATAVAVGTGNFTSPSSAKRVIDGIEAYLIDHKVRRVTDLIGSLDLTGTAREVTKWSS
ncbi:MAG: dihydroorotate dehydrogenase [candidate division NC10 bacterium]|nr:dihydroorotate dehydrogenase [candidate division NC10 bacterium]MDE2320691.1 dihydroorotate dehydrogenase [candidate division NC10 bacterium]